jgi:hypothetical protein
MPAVQAPSVTELAFLPLRWDEVAPSARKVPQVRGAPAKGEVKATGDRRVAISCWGRTAVRLHHSLFASRYLLPFDQSLIASRPSLPSSPLLQDGLGEEGDEQFVVSRQVVTLAA